MRSPILLLLTSCWLVACDRHPNKSGPGGTSNHAVGQPAAPGANGPQGAAPLSTVVVNHGDLDRQVPKDTPRIAAINLASTVYKLPNTASRRLGYVRLGGIVARDPEALSGSGCKKNDWYRVYPTGYVCGDEFTTDLEAPLVRASARRPKLDQPLPYSYGFVRATSPQYLRIPSKAEQEKSEFQLPEHMDWFRQNSAEVQTVVLGAGDVPLDARGVAVPNLPAKSGYIPATSLSLARLFGAERDDEGPPFWLLNHGRAIANVSGFDVPEYAVFADRVRRHTGLSFVGSFSTEDQGLERRFAITVDLRLIPTSKVKPDTGSAFHGIEIPPGLELPFAWVNVSDAKLYELLRGKDEVRQVSEAPRRSLVLLTGNARIKQGKRFYQTRADATRWLLGSELSAVHLPEVWPEPAEKAQKWIDISIGQQTLVLYDGKVPRYATMVSSGRDRFGDPKKDLATPLGDFYIQSKHIAAAMDSEENSTLSGGQKVGRSAATDGEAEATVLRLKKLKKDGGKLSTEDARRWANIEKGRHPEYGVTARRGSTSFELRDVPWIQYFSSGFALHGAYWHDVFGVPRSHGCVNLSPIDARLVFLWTDPPVPEGWHGINSHSDTGEGTWVHIRK